LTKSPSYAFTISYLGLAAFYLNDFSKSMNYLEQAKALEEELIGTKHPM